MQTVRLIAVALLAVGLRQPVAQENVLKASRGTIVSAAKEGYVVAPKVTGFMQELTVREGDVVRKGQKIGRLDDRRAQMDRKVAKEKAENRVNIDYADAQHALAATNVKRLGAANQRTPGAVPEMELEQARLEERRAFYQGKQAVYNQTLERLELEKAEMLLEDHDIICQFDGIVGPVLRHPGEPVREGEVILRVYPTKDFRIEGSFPVKDFFLVQRGQRVEVRIAVEGIESETLQGRVISAEPIIEAGEFTVIAEIESRNRRLIDGLDASMTIHLDTRDTRVSRSRR